MSDKPQAPLLRRRLLKDFMTIAVVLVALCLALTSLSFYAYYRTSLSQQLESASASVNESLNFFHKEVVSHAALFFSLHKVDTKRWRSTVVHDRIDLVTVEWLEMAGVTLVGDGDLAYWLRNGFTAKELEPVFNGEARLIARAPPGEPMMLYSAIPEPLDSLDTTVVVFGREITDQWLAELARRLGYEVVFYNDSGEVSASSTQMPYFDRRSLFGSKTVEIGGDVYAARYHPLTIAGARRSGFAIFTPVEELRTLGVSLTGFLFIGIFFVFIVSCWTYRGALEKATSQIDLLVKWSRDYYTSRNPYDPPPGEYLELQVLSGTFGDLLDKIESARVEIEEKNVRLEKLVEKKDREAVEQSHLFDAIVSEMPQNVFVIDENGVVVYANPSALKQFKAEIGQPLPEAILGSQEEADKESDQWVATLGGKRLLVHVQDFESSKNRMLVIQDITGEQLTEERLFQGQKLESVSRLAGGVAHDFNNALASIIPCVEMLRLQTEDAKSVGYIDTIEKAALRGADVVRRLLAFSRTGDFREVELDVNNLVSGVVEMLRPIAKGVHVVWTPAVDPPKLMGDENHLQQALLNIALNSMDVVGKNGYINFEAWTNTDKSKVYIAIEDDGPGVPEQIADIIFDPFFSTKPQDKGTGLGLSVTYGVIERHGGKIELVKGTGPGARFQIELPAKLAEADPDDTASSGKTEDIIIGG